jgi:hypothetical protein
VRQLADCLTVSHMPRPTNVCKDVGVSIRSTESRVAITAVDGVQTAIGLAITVTCRSLYYIVTYTTAVW